VTEERLKLAVFIDFDNIQIGVKDTLSKEFDVSLVLEALKERGEVVTKVAYGDWPRAGEQSRQMTQHAVQMVQRNVTPRGDKNGADINLALDALEMAFTRHHINTFAIVGGDSDFIALVEKLKQYDKRVFVVGGRAFTSNILQRNCTEFIAYENLLRGGAGGDASRSRASRRGETPSRAALETRPLSDALPNVQRALKILEDREVAPQLGLLKSTLLQLDSTFTERDFGTTSFLEFVQKMEAEGLVKVRRTDRGYLVEPAGGAPETASAPEAATTSSTAQAEEPAAIEEPAEEGPSGVTPEATMSSTEALSTLKQALASASEKSPNRPLYMRHIRQALRAVDKNFDERRAGFHGTLDLLHQAQREGWLRLQRDRKGVWRIFPVSPTTSVPADISPEMSPSPVPVVEDQAIASTDFWESDEIVTAPLLATELSEQPPLKVAGEVASSFADAAPSESPSPLIEESAPVESIQAEPTARPESPPRVRKSRATRGAAKTTRRRAPTGRKTKEPAVE
jgi:uncharacterized LabA/DUF88 family protein